MSSKFAPEPPDEIPPDAVVTGIANGLLACKWCDNQAAVWVKQFPRPGVVYLRSWCAECFNDACPPFGENQPEVDGQQIMGENAIQKGQTLNEWIETETAGTASGGIAATALYKQYAAFCKERAAETVSEAAFLGRLASRRSLKLEGESDDSGDALSGLYLRGVIPA